MTWLAKYLPKQIILDGRVTIIFTSLATHGTLQTINIEQHNHMETP